jgi:FkbM family methyltransferase
LSGRGHGWSLRAARVLLRWGPLRRRLAFAFRHDHLGELGLRLPIGHGIACPVGAEDTLLSLGEIFGEGEYAGLGAALPAPRRWLDLGAHAGYFSLALAAQAARAGVVDWAALLVEPDPRHGPTLRAGLAQPALRGRARLLAAAVGAGGGRQRLALRHGMVSSLDLAAGARSGEVEVPVIGAAELLAELPPPYDLVKIDIEGAEHAFLPVAGDLCRATRALVLEWHAPTVDDPSVAVLRRTLAGHGLGVARALRAPHVRAEPGPLAVSGLELFTRA